MIMYDLMSKFEPLNENPKKDDNASINAHGVDASDFDRQHGRKSHSRSSSDHVNHDMGMSEVTKLHK